MDPRYIEAFVWIGFVVFMGVVILCVVGAIAQAFDDEDNNRRGGGGFGDG